MLLLLQVQLEPNFFCAVGLDLEFCPCLIRGIAKYVPS